jgi:glycosyltransferase involved in cell wall biosynthesis
MLNGKKIVVVLPAYNAEKTLSKTLSEIPNGLADEILLVDDRSSDQTAELAEQMPVITKVIRHQQNLGYGGNQKTCYKEALQLGADIVIMLHPDYQYDPRLLAAMASPIAYGVYDVMLGSRILGGKALQGGMPLLKYVLNRLTTFIWNLLYWQKLSEFHTGYRAFHREVLEKIPFEQNSDDFVFDHQILAQIFFHGFNTGEVSCPTRYSPEASSIGLLKGTVYLLRCFETCAQFVLQKWGGAQFSLFSKRS